MASGAAISNSKEWRPCREEIKRLMKMVRVQYTLQILQSKHDSVGRETFTTDGLHLVLLSACLGGSVPVIQHFIDNHINLFDINETFRYGYTLEWRRPVNYVTITEHTIGFIDEKREERFDTLLSFTQRYCCENKDEVTHLLQKHGAN